VNIYTIHGSHGQENVLFGRGGDPIAINSDHFGQSCLAQPPHLSDMIRTCNPKANQWVKWMEMLISNHISLVMIWFISQPFKIASTLSSRKLPPSATRANTVTPMSKVSLVPQLPKGVTTNPPTSSYAALNQIAWEIPQKKHSKAKHVRSLLEKIILNTYIQIHKRSCFFLVYFFGGSKI